MSTQSSIPDLFSHSSASQPSSPTGNSPAASKITASSRHILPADLPNAIKQLDDQEFDRLLEVVLAEQKRRGRKLAPSYERSRKKRVEEIEVSLAQGKLNAVRAAFKAGHHSIENCSTVRDLTVRRTQGVGVRRRKTVTAHVRQHKVLPYP